MEQDAACPLCRLDPADVVWQDAQCLIVRVGGELGARHAGYCRVIWREHVREMTDLSASERRHLMQLVCALEAALRALLHPDKINLASLGNQVPHLHWHVIPRWHDDSHFPEPIWAPSQRAGVRRAWPERALLCQKIEEALAEEGAGA